MTVEPFGRVMMLLPACVRAIETIPSPPQRRPGMEKAIIRNSSKNCFSFYSASFAFLETHL